MDKFLVANLFFSLKIPGAKNIKDRRNIVRSLKDRLKNRFNISVISNEKNQNFKFCSLGISFVVMEKVLIDTTSDRIVRFIEDNFDINIVDFGVEIY